MVNENGKLCIELDLNEEFVKEFEYLSDKYGEKFLSMNGFGKSNLNFSDFIDNFVDTEVVADAVMDSSAAIGTHDICILTNDMTKPHSKLLAFNKIFYEHIKKYGLEQAKKWLENEWCGGGYLHDAHSSSYLPYSYKGSETILVKYKNYENPLLIPFSDLYDLVDEEEILLSEKDEAYCKYTDELLVWDSDRWSKVLRVIRKPKTMPFHFVKTQNGLTEVVTANHPLITGRGDVEAKDAIVEKDILYTEAPTASFGNEDELYITNELLPLNYPLFFRGFEATKESFNKIGQVSYFNYANPIPNYLKIDFNFGYLVGMILGDGSTTENNISITQLKNDYFEKIIEILESMQIPYAVHRKDVSSVYNIVIRSKVFKDLIYEKFIVRGRSYTKHLNPNIFRFNKEFIRGIIGGLIDSDGTISGADRRRLHLRMTSRHLLMQVGYLIRMFGYNTREQQPSIYTPRVLNDGIIRQTRYIYHLAVTPFKDREWFDSIKIRAFADNFTTYAEGAHCINNKYTVGYGKQLIANNIQLLDHYDMDEYVYDITTETGHFTCNGILSHNCFAYDLDLLVEKGLFFTEKISSGPAKHLTTFNDHVLEYIGWLTNRSSGAVGLPSYLVYSWYFWYKDINDNFYLKDPEYYRRQCFQKFV